MQRDMMSKVRKFLPEAFRKSNRKVRDIRSQEASIARVLKSTYKLFFYDTVCVVLWRVLRVFPFILYSLKIREGESSALSVASWVQPRW